MALGPFASVTEVGAIPASLGNTFAIANVQKDHAAMIPTPMYPTAESHLLTFMTLVDRPAIMSAHNH